MATAAAAAAMTSTDLRSSVLGGYRRLMRLRLQVFVGDQYAIDQARLKLRAEFLKHRVCTGLGRAREGGREVRMWNVDLAGRLSFSLCSACAQARVPESFSYFTRLTSSPSPPSPPSPPSLPPSLLSSARAEP